MAKRVRRESKDDVEHPSLTKTPEDGASPGDDSWESVRRNHDRCVTLGHLFDIAQPPAINDVEIIVCFCDIRGFTQYCNDLQQRSLDNRIQNFLKRFTRLFSLCIMEAIWRLEPTDSDTKMTSQTARLREAVVPSTYKNLGDGMMLVWELPNDIDEVIQGQLTHRILEIAFYIFRRFVESFDEPDDVAIDAFGEKVRTLRIGFGMARGHAWKLDFGHHLKPDYAGSVVNLAARLQDRARPEGILCQYELSKALFDRLIAAGHGRVRAIRGLRGMADQKAVFLGRLDLEAFWKRNDLYRGHLPRAVESKTRPRRKSVQKALPSAENGKGDIQNTRE